MPSIWDPLPIDGEKSDSTMLIVSITHQLQARQPRTVFCTKCCCTAVLRHPRIQNCFQKNTTAFMPPAMVCMVIHFHCYCWLPLLTEFLRLYQEQPTASSSNSNLWLLLLSSFKSYHGFCRTWSFMSSMLGLNARSRFVVSFSVIPGQVD